MKRFQVSRLFLGSLVAFMVSCGLQQNNPTSGEDVVSNEPVYITNLQWFFYKTIYDDTSMVIELPDNIDEWTNVKVIMISNNCYYETYYSNKTFLDVPPFEIEVLTSSEVKAKYKQTIFITNDSLDIVASLKPMISIKYAYEKQNNTNFLYINQYRVICDYQVFSNNLLIASDKATNCLVGDPNLGGIFKQWVYINFTNL